MSDVPSGPAEHVSALLRLVCRRGHHVGQLFMPSHAHHHIEYRKAGQTGTPEFWPLDRADFWSEPVCPGGCQFEVGAPADGLIRRVVALANNPDADEGTFTLTHIRPAQATR
jgi:hypothetical protein